MMCSVGGGELIRETWRSLVSTNAGRALLLPFSAAKTPGNIHDAGC